MIFSLFWNLTNGLSWPRIGQSKGTTDAESMPVSWRGLGCVWSTTIILEGLYVAGGQDVVWDFQRSLPVGAVEKEIWEECKWRGQLGSTWTSPTRADDRLSKRSRGKHGEILQLKPSIKSFLWYTDIFNQEISLILNSELLGPSTLVAQCNK